MMLNIFQKTGLLAVFLGISLPLNAQTNSLESDFLKDIEAGENMEWNFSSSDEPISVKDDLKELGDYSISESDPIDFELEENGQRLDTRRYPQYIERYSIETEVYDY